MARTENLKRIGLQQQNLEFGDAQDQLLHTHQTAKLERELAQRRLEEAEHRAREAH